MAYEFDGTTQRLSVASAPVTAAPMTMACWFRTTNMTQSTRCLIGINSTTINTNYFSLFFRGDIAGDPIQILTQQAGGNQLVAQSTTGCTSGKWHHACAVEASETSRTVYLDAGSSATNTTSAIPAGLNRFEIASWRAGLFFNGLIAEVGIWNAALTQPEIASLAKGMTCDKIRPQNLVFYAPLVHDLVDQKGGLTITNNNGAAVANHPRVYA